MKELYFYCITFNKEAKVQPKTNNNNFRKEPRLGVSILERYFKDKRIGYFRTIVEPDNTLILAVKSPQELYHTLAIYDDGSITGIQFLSLETAKTFDSFEVVEGKEYKKGVVRNISFYPYKDYVLVADRTLQKTEMRTSIRGETVDTLVPEDERIEEISYFHPALFDGGTEEDMTPSRKETEDQYKEFISSIAPPIENVEKRLQ